MEAKKLHALGILGACLILSPASVFAYPTLSASEEDPPAACNIGDAVYGATCYGSYCDNTQLYCEDSNFSVSNRYWTSNFSEEGTSYRYCGSNEIMTGISFSGGYGDNVSIECSTIPRTRYNCGWVGPYSEEQGYREFGGRYANGMYCSGSNCDNHWYYVCNY